MRPGVFCCRPRSSTVSLRHPRRGSRHGDAGRVLAELERSNLFHVALDGRGTGTAITTCSELLSIELATRARRSCPSSKAGGSEWFHANGFIARLSCTQQRSATRAGRAARRRASQPHPGRQDRRPHGLSRPPLGRRARGSPVVAAAGAAVAGAHGATRRPARRLEAIAEENQGPSECGAALRRVRCFPDPRVLLDQGSIHARTRDSRGRGGAGHVPDLLVIALDLRVCDVSSRRLHRRSRAR